MDLIADENGTLFLEQYAKNIQKDFSAGLPVTKKAHAYPSKTPASQAIYSKPLASNFKQNVDKNRSPSFSVSPQTVQFLDFEPGKSYLSKVTVTNCTNKLRRIRALPISPQYRMFFSVDSNVSPAISPGLQWTINVSFLSNKLECISGELHLRVDDGSIIQIFMTARPKQFAPSIDVESIDFGTVTIGSTKKKKLIIRNQGALSGRLKISGSFENVMKETHTDPLTGEEEHFLSMLPNVYKFDMSPLSQKKIEFVFAPLEKCEMRCSIFVEGDCLNHTIALRGTSTDLPVFLPSAELDFRCCFYANMYSSKIAVRNTLSVPTKVTPKVPTYLKSALRFEPSSLIIQPDASLFFNVLFEPSVDLGDRVDALVEFHAKGQSIPSGLKVSAILTHRSFTIEPSAIEIGSMFVNEEKQLYFVTQNSSLLPQEVECVNLPRNITVVPKKTTLLPKESFQFTLFFRPSKIDKIDLSFMLRNAYGDSTVLKLSGSAREPILFFSESTIYFPVCPFGGSISASTILKNNSDDSREFHFSTPSELLTISPSTGVLKPSESIPIVIFFQPRRVDTKKEELEKHSSLVLHKQKSNAPKVFANISQTSLSLDDFFSTFATWEGCPGSHLARHRTMVVHCASDDVPSQCPSLVIDCTVIFPEVTVTEVSTGEEAVCLKPSIQQTLGKPSNPTASNLLSVPHKSTLLTKSPGCSTELNFFEVALNQSLTKTCLIKNNSDVPVSFQLQPLSPMSNFSVVRPPAEILEPNQVDHLLILFNPRECGIFYDEFTLFSELNSLTIRLRGICTDSELLISTDSNLNEPSSRKGSSAKEIVFAPTFVGDSLQRLLYFNNVENSAVDVSLRFANEETVNGCTEGFAEPFLFHPAAFTVPPGSKTTVAVLFCPQNPGKFISTACVTSGKTKRTITLSGWSTEKRVYARWPYNEQPDYMDGKCTSLLNLPFQGQSEDFPFMLDFTPGETKKMILGTVKGGPLVECVVNALESSTTDGWAVSEQKLSIASGSEATISFTLAHRKSSDDPQMRFAKYTIAIKCLADPSNDYMLFYSFSERE